MSGHLGPLALVHCADAADRAPLERNWKTSDCEGDDMPGSLTGRGLHDCYATEVMNAVVVDTPNPRDEKELACRAFDIADATLEESGRPVPQPEGSSGIGVYV